MKKKLYLIFFVIIFILSFKTNASPLEQNKIGIDIKGAVKYPGLYYLDYNSTIYDAIKISGGLLSNADTSIINLSKTLKNEEVVIIYTIDEIEKMKEGNTKGIIIEKECMCPKIESVGCIKNVISKINIININTASLEELTTLPSIGESKAKLIIEYRNNKLFTKIEDIMNVKGIGKSIFDKIKEYITV